MDTLELVSWQKVLQQPTDSCHDSHDGFQQIEVSTADAGAGIFYLLKTNRWAIESIDDVIEVLRLAGIPEKSAKDPSHG